MYELVNIDEYNKGYKIEWKELEKILDEICPEEKWGNGFYSDWKCSNWIKKDDDGKIIHDRTYISKKTYRKREIRKEEHLGYYNNITEMYVVTDRRKVITDVIAVYQSKKGE